MLRDIIEALKVENDYRWTKNYYNEAAQEKIEQLRKTTPNEVIEQGQRDWAALIADVEEAAARNEDARSDRAQELANRWRGLVGQFTKGDPDVSQGLNRLWSDPSHWPADFKRPWSDAADAWIKRAMKCG